MSKVVELLFSVCNFINNQKEKKPKKELISELQELEIKEPESGMSGDQKPKKMGVHLQSNQNYYVTFRI